MHQQDTIDQCPLCKEATHTGTPHLSCLLIKDIELLERVIELLTKLLEVK